MKLEYKSDLNTFLPRT